MLAKCEAASNRCKRPLGAWALKRRQALRKILPALALRRLRRVRDYIEPSRLRKRFPQDMQTSRAHCLKKSRAMFRAIPFARFLSHSAKFTVCKDHLQAAWRQCGRKQFPASCCSEAAAMHIHRLVTTALRHTARNRVSREDAGATNRSRHREMGFVSLARAWGIVRKATGPTERKRMLWFCDGTTGRAGYVFKSRWRDRAESRRKIMCTMRGWYDLIGRIRRAPRTGADWLAHVQGAFRRLRQLPRAQRPLRLQTCYLLSWALRAHLLDLMWLQKVPALKLAGMRVRGFLQLCPDQKGALSALYDSIRHRGAPMRTASQFLRALGTKTHHRPELTSFHACFALDRGIRVSDLDVDIETWRAAGDAMKARTRVEPHVAVVAQAAR